MTIVTLKKDGASCTINSFGATVTSFKDSTGRENLFVSSLAKTDGSKAIRGGIPIVFPIFGPPSGDSTMPQHGYARVNDWTILAQDDGSASFQLALKDAQAGRGTNNPWDPSQSKTDGTDCVLTYNVQLQANQLTTALLVDNTGSDSFDFQCLLHTYLAANLDQTVSVHGLGGYSITDKVSGDSGNVQSYEEDVALTKGIEVDRVYIHPDHHPTFHGVITTDDASKVRIEAAGMVDETPVPISPVVWNPGTSKAAAMSDFGNEEYSNMICVEPGLLGHVPLLAPGKQARLTQSIVVGA